MSDRITKNISLPEAYWQKIEEKRDSDILIRSRSDVIIVMMRELYPELKVKQ